MADSTDATNQVPAPDAAAAPKEKKLTPKELRMLEKEAKKRAEVSALHFLALLFATFLSILCCALFPRRNRSSSLRSFHSTKCTALFSLVAYIFFYPM